MCRMKWGAKVRKVMRWMEGSEGAKNYNCQPLLLTFISTRDLSDYYGMKRNAYSREFTSKNDIKH